MVEEGGRGGYVVACGSDGMFEARRPERIARELGEGGVGRGRFLMDLVVPKVGSGGYCDDVSLVALEIGGGGGGVSVGGG